MLRVSVCLGVLVGLIVCICLIGTITHLSSNLSRFGSWWLTEILTQQVQKGTGQELVRTWWGPGNWVSTAVGRRRSPYLHLLLIGDICLRTMEYSPHFLRRKCVALKFRPLMGEFSLVMIIFKYQKMLHIFHSIVGEVSWFGKVCYCVSS